MEENTTPVEETVEKSDFFGALYNPMPNIEGYMKNLAEVEVIEEGAIRGICEIIEGEINQMRYQIVDVLTEKMETYDEEENLPYSLGLVHAIDTVLGRVTLESVEEEFLEQSVLPDMSEAEDG